MNRFSGLNLTGFLILILAGCHVADRKSEGTDAQYRYGFKSARIEYILDGSETLSHLSGTKTIWIDDYGDKKAVLEKKTTTTQAGNYSSSLVTETLTITVGNSVWTIDLNDKSGTVSHISGVDEQAEVLDDLTAHTIPDSRFISDEFIENNGGSWLGKKKYLGRTCSAVEYSGIRQWIYKGLSLKTESSRMGEQYNEKAVDMDEGCDIPASRFEIPSDIAIRSGADDNAPVKTVNEYGMETTVSSGESLSLPFETFKLAAGSVRIPGFEYIASTDNGVQYSAAFLKNMTEAVGITVSPLDNAGNNHTITINPGTREYNFNGHKAMYSEIEDQRAQGSLDRSLLLIEIPEKGVILAIDASPARTRAQLESIADQLNF